MDVQPLLGSNRFLGKLKTATFAESTRRKGVQMRTLDVHCLGITPEESHLKLSSVSIKRHRHGVACPGQGDVEGTLHSYCCVVRAHGQAAVM